jgi:acetyltransferase
MRAIADSAQLRLCGPGSFGIISVHDHLSAYMAPFRGGIRAGSIAVLTQSGSLINGIVGLGQERQMGFSLLASAGSEAGLTATDYLSFFVEDPSTHVVAAVIEQFRDPAAWVRVAARAAELGKPMVVLKLGRSEIARQATIAHTGALAGSPEFHDAVFRRYGVCSVGNLDELIETASLLAQAPLPRGPRVGILSVSGGDCVLASDVAARIGLQLASLSEHTQAGLRALISEVGLTVNPVDIGMRPLWEPGLFGKALQLVADDPSVDVLAVRFNPDVTLFGEMQPVAEKPGLPVVSFTRATQALSAETYAISHAIGVPILQEVEKGFTAVHHLTQYAEFQRRRAATGPCTRRSPPAERAVAEILTRQQAVLTEVESKKLLAHYGFPVTAEVLVDSEAEAVRAADQMGYPVALKVMSPQIVHKTEANVVALNLRSDRDVRAAYVRVVAAAARVAGADVHGVLVQEMALPGTELVLGATRDAEFGLGIVVGLGGVFVEVLRESSLRLPPLDLAEATAMIDETRAGQVLRGVRGRQGADINAVADLVVRLAEVCGDFGDALDAIDINPLVVYEAPRGMKVLDATIALRSASDSGHTRANW